MVRLLLTMTVLLFHFGVFAFEKLPPAYQITFGNPKAPVCVVEYFSLSCGKCIDSFKKDFKALKGKYIDTEEVFWIFHPHPADLKTVEALICLEKLSPKEKRIFWEVVLENLEGNAQDRLLMQLAMETLGKPVPELNQIEELKKTESFRKAYEFLIQKDIVRELPTVEINGKIYSDFPSKKFLEKTLNALVAPKRQP